MFQNKFLNTFLIVLIAISLLAIVVVLTYILVSDGKSDAAPVTTEKVYSGKEVQEFSLNTEKITTNLADGKMIVLSLSLMTDGKKAKEELELRSTQLKDIIITTLHSQTKQDFETTEGLEAYKLLIMQKVNELMEKGTIVDVYYIDKIIN